MAHLGLKQRQEVTESSRQLVVQNSVKQVDKFD